MRGPVRYVVGREGAEHIVIERHAPGGSVLRIVASLEFDGNIVTYEGTPGKESNPIFRKGTYEWAKHGMGGWYLKRYEYVRTHEGNRKDPEFRYVLDVESFDPKPLIAKDRFQESSLQLPPGTVVEEVGQGEDRRYKVGQEEGVSQKDLDDLSRRLRAMRFAAPK